MCGIAGYIDLKDNAKLEVIEQMTDAIKHRGPDGFGHKIFNNVSIGHRRLSIIDLKDGIQPMSNVAKTLWITYNGELYNYKQIKHDLINLGFNFNTDSDTEVIIYAYQKWGKDCIKRFKGMFAFSILDLVKQEFFLARDHFGIKPLFYYQSDNIVAFGSELQQFKKLPNFNKSINFKAIDQYLWMQYVPAPLTVFNSIKKLKAAHYIVINFKGEVSEQQNYWDLDYSLKKTKTNKQWLDETNEILQSSVKSHLMSDVPFGAFLSGGIDSTLVVNYMSKILDKPVKTFSIGFKEEEYNELQYAELASKILKTDHYTEIVEPDALSILPELVKHYGEPFGDSSCIPTYYVSKLAAKHVKMVLSGDGGDECFAGYSTYLNYTKNLPENKFRGIKKMSIPLLKKLQPNKYIIPNNVRDWIPYMQYMNNSWRTLLWKEEFKEQIVDLPEGFKELDDKINNFTTINKFQYIDMKTYLNFDILNKVDIASMMHSIEVRTPLIDRDVWEHAATIPEKFLINKSSGSWQGKMLLKKLLSEHFNPDFIYRRKQGFGVPISKWFAKNGQLNEMINDKLLSQNSFIKNYFNTNTINELIKNNNTGPLWLLLFLEEWLNQNN